MTFEFLHVGSVSVEETMYLVVSLKNGAPGSSSTVRVDHGPSNASYVLRPSRIPRLRPVTAARRSPILGSKPYSNVHVGASITPSRLMNSCTCIAPMLTSWSILPWRDRRNVDAPKPRVGWLPRAEYAAHEHE